VTHVRGGQDTIAGMDPLSAPPRASPQLARKRRRALEIRALVAQQHLIERPDWPRHQGGAKCVLAELLALQRLREAELSELRKELDQQK